MAQRILIAGYYGFGNLGDEAILTAMARDILGRLPGAQLTVVSGDPDDTHARHSLRAIQGSDASSLIDAVRHSDLLVLGGGGLLHDYWPVDPGRMFSPSQSGLEFYTSLPWLAELAGVPSMLYAVGLGPLRDPAARELARSALARCEWVSVRDHASAELAAEIVAGLAHPPPIEAVADPALNLEPAPASAAATIFRQAGVPGDRPLIAAVLRPWPFAADASRDMEQIAEGLSQAARRLEAHVVLIPFQRPTQASTHDDLEHAHRVRSRMAHPELASVIAAAITPEVAAAAISACRVALAQRYHAAVFALGQGVPCVSLDYDPKLSALMQSMGCGEYCLRPAEWTAQAIADRLSAAGTEPPRSLAAALSTARQLAGRPAEWIQVRLLGAPPQAVGGRGDVVDQAIMNRLADAGRVPDLEFENRILNLQLERLGQERERVGRELAALRSTRGVRLLAVYWNVLHQLLPVGSRRREWARVAAGGLRQTLKRAIQPRMTTHPARAPANAGGEVRLDPSPVRATDPRVDLLRFEAQAVRRARGPLFVILTTTQLSVSEGQRSTQFAQELSRRGLPVIHSGWRWQADDLVLQDRMDHHLLRFPFDMFLNHTQEVLSVAGGLERVLLVEFPHPSLFAALARAGGLGWLTVYDIMDDWQAFHAAGQAPWFNREFELHLTASADLVSAVSAPLAARARQAGRDEVLLLPNAACLPTAEPGDPIRLPRGERMIGYFGHLTPAWFDWDLVRAAAVARPTWRFYLIGYGGPDGRAELPENVILLGRQPQSALPAFAKNWDAAIVPFKSGALAQAVDAIKIYEYLSMGLPVVVSGVYPPVGAEALVRRAEGAGEFIRALEQAQREAGGFVSAARDYAAANTWSARLDSLLASLAAGDQRVAMRRALFTPTQ